MAQNVLEQIVEEMREMPLFLILSDLENCKGQKPIGSNSTSL